MNHLIIRILIALLTFTIGALSAKLLFNYHYSDQQLVKLIPDNTPTLPLSSQNITFSDGGIVTAFQPYYYSSDGMTLRFGCVEQKSTSKAIKMLREEIISKHIIERASKLDENGKTIGERVIFTDSPKSENETKIIWTERNRYFRIRAPSIRHALLFEESQIWNDGYCIKFK